MNRSAQRGTTLIIVLLLLLILTMLMLASAGTATAELVMAGNEQYRKHASDAASAGIEQAIARIAASGATNVSVPPTAFGGSATDTYATTTQYAGQESALPQSSANKFVGLHYAIVSTGTSLRGAVDVQTQGVLVVAPTGNTGTFSRIGSGLQGGSGP
jgi:Tfp pilus assembly protein PilX